MEFNTLSSAKGRLDGLSLFRFALVKKNIGGGIEEHLRNVNRLLLERNSMSIVQTYLESGGPNNSIKIEAIGRGKLIWVPLKPFNKENSIDYFVIFKLCPWLIKCAAIPSIIKLIGRKLGKLIFSKKSAFHFYSQEPGKFFAHLNNQHNFNIAILHSLASLDDVDIIGELIHLDIPFTAIHHFENSRLLNPLIRLKLKRTNVIGVISALDVPNYLRHRSINVQEGVDTDFYQVEKSTPILLKSNTILILLPARISRSKGQLDLIEAIRLLNRHGFNLTLALAGRIDDEHLMNEIASAVNRLPDPEKVMILGDLDQITLRNWYAACKVVVMPSYSEGLGRTLLEAQAMRRPVIAYSVGGVSSAMIDGETGFLVTKGDVHGLTATLRLLLNNEQRIEQMGKSGRKFVETNFSLAKLVESHEELYLSVLKKHGYR